MRSVFQNLSLLSLLCFFNLVNAQMSEIDEPIDDHEKAIRAVNDGEILPLDEILVRVSREFTGRVISISLKDSEKGLFGWVYDIMIIEPGNYVKQLRVDAGTSTILSIRTGER